MKMKAVYKASGQGDKQEDLIKGDQGTQEGQQAWKGK